MLMLKDTPCAMYQAYRLMCSDVPDLLYDCNFQCAWNLLPRNAFVLSLGIRILREMS